MVGIDKKCLALGMTLKFLILDPRKRRLPQNVFLGQTNPPVILSVLDIILILDLPSRLFFVEPPQNIRHQQKIFSNHDIQRVIQVEPFNFNLNRFSRTGDEKEDSDETQDKITQHDKSQ